MHLVAVDLTTGSMAFCVSKEKSIPAVCNIFDSIMHLQKALRSLREKSWKNNLLFVSPSIRRPTVNRNLCCYRRMKYWQKNQRNLLWSLFPLAGLIFYSSNFLFIFLI